MNNISDNIIHIQNRISKACEHSKRHPDEVKLLLATKTVSAENIIKAIHSGCNLIAENKIQELKEKHKALQTVPHINHFIGHLQTNKIKDLIHCEVTCLHALDRIELAEKLDKRLAFENKKMDVLIQVNTSHEPSKFGLHPDSVLDFILKISEFKNINIQGLMTIGLFSAEHDKVRACFRKLAEISKHIASLHIPHVQMNELSMGMSNDLEIAIEEGATIVRIGTAIFGERQYPDSYYWKEN